MTSSSSTEARPIIGLTTYRKSSRDTNRPLFGLMRAYVEAVSSGGGIPLLIPLGLSDEDLLTVVERVDGLVLPGGGDIDPNLYQGTEHHALRGIDQDRDRAHHTGTPVTQEESPHEQRDDGDREHGRNEDR